MIERLKLRILKAEHLVHRIIEKAPDACRSYTGCFRFQVEYLSDHTGLPEQASVKPRAISADGRFELGNHAQRKGSGSGDVLMATHLSGQLAGIAFLQAIEREVIGTPRWPRP